MNLLFKILFWINLSQLRSALKETILLRKVANKILVIR